MSSLPFVSLQKTRSTLQLKSEKEDRQISKNVGKEKVGTIDGPDYKLYKGPASMSLHFV